jgi:recombination endonuclease VII
MTKKKRYPHKPYVPQYNEEGNKMCGKCNIGLGSFKDNEAYLQAAIEYLKNVS